MMNFNKIILYQISKEKCFQKIPDLLKVQSVIRGACVVYFIDLLKVQSVIRGACVVYFIDLLKVQSVIRGACVVYFVDLLKVQLSKRTVSNTWCLWCLFYRFSKRTHEVALIFDAVFLLAHALEAYDRGAVLRPVNVSCDIPQPWSSGPSLYTYLTQVSMRGMTGNIKLQKGRRYDFQLDILQLKPPGLLKSGTWKYDKGVNFTYVPGTKHMNPFGNKTLVVTTILDIKSFKAPFYYRILKLLLGILHRVQTTPPFGIPPRGLRRCQNPYMESL
ncbi:hypothetical protein LOTGIDRAFT_162828 [Lottia gigantea]|uniref:Receptor ligand binding region domain-containing protein n=1 Tax=Lottia gigantea TaxID=225164 RepID=V4BSW2_LOTGI|nr:hypothetical protein LOTGIDRAFT_162828 [Lottia gigantea]ESO92174.1 hypothetical protein LOTGIDRAFT_162828 [Lottia gigantea]